MNPIGKYIFGMLVVAYVITTIGVPVYLHYCGGELETISYITKSNSCCGGEESDEDDNGCCNDEGYVLKSYLDCTTKDSTPKLVKDLFPVLSIFFNFNLVEKTENAKKEVAENGRPPRNQDYIISVSVLRI